MWYTSVYFNVVQCQCSLKHPCIQFYRYTWCFFWTSRFFSGSRPTPHQSHKHRLSVQDKVFMCLNPLHIPPKIREVLLISEQWVELQELLIYAPSGRCTSRTAGFLMRKNETRRCTKKAHVNTTHKKVHLSFSLVHPQRRRTFHWHPGARGSQQGQGLTWST